MSDINRIDLRLVDTQVLLVFLATVRLRKTTAVAVQMGLTQPAVSHALKRLRQLYGDPLFLRRAHGLEPTAFALELEPKVRDIVRLIAETLEGPKPFDPRTARLDLRIGTFDYEAATLIPDLVARLDDVAPNVRVHAYPLYDEQALDALSRGQIDLSIGYFDEPEGEGSSFLFEKLCDEVYVVVARRAHPIFARDLTLATIALARHILVSPHGPARTLVDHALRLDGLTRSIHTVVPSVFPALSIVEASDLIVVLPKRIAERNVARFGLAYRPLPIQGGTFALHSVRHIRDANSALHLWLQDTLSSLIG